MVAPNDEQLKEALNQNPETLEIIKMIKFINQGDKDTRSGFGEGLTELGRKNSEVVALCADLTGFEINVFADENPERLAQA